MQKNLQGNIMSVFSKKKKLIVCGCSYSDNYATREGIGNFKVYGQLLAEKLDMELVNLSLCGFGNKGIFTSIIDSILNQKPPKDIGLVIAQWSEFQRVDGFVKNPGFGSWDSIYKERRRPGPGSYGVARAYYPEVGKMGQYCWHRDQYYKPGLASQP